MHEPNETGTASHGTKVREALRQAERMLATQQDARESALRRTGELLRLAIVTLGAVLAAAGIMTTTGARIGAPLGLTLLSGVCGVSSAILQLSVVIAGMKGYGPVAYGPDLRRLLDAAQNNRIDDASYYESLVRSIGACIADNVASSHHVQRAKGRALWCYIFGAALLLAGGVYITGGAIHG